MTGLMLKYKYLLVVFLIIFCWGAWSSSQKREFIFISIGDWGSGSASQKLVAKAIEKISKEENIAFVLNLGDAFYNAGVTGLDDPKFNSFYENIYGSALKVPWYITIGDHDHRGDVSAMLKYKSKHDNWIFPSLYYTFSHGGGYLPTLKGIVVDSVGLEGAFTEEGDDRRFQEDYTPLYTDKKAGEEQITWLKHQLAKTNSQSWNIVIGHRPVLTSVVRPRTAAENKTAAMVQTLLHDTNVDLYINGHDHSVQHLSDSRITYLVNGVGGHKTFHNRTHIPQVVYSDAFYGFCIHRVKANTLTTQFVDHFGNIKYETVLTK